MIRTQATWGDVAVGDFVVGRGDAAWKLEYRDHQEIVLKNRDGEEKTLPAPPDGAPIVKFVKTDDEKAVDLVRIGLGGELLGIRGTSDSSWKVPELLEVAQAQRHLLDMHRIDCADIHDLEQLTAIHAETPASEGREHDHKHGLRP